MNSEKNVIVKGSDRLPADLSALVQLVAWWWRHKKLLPQPMLAKFYNEYKQHQESFQFVN